MKALIFANGHPKQGAMVYRALQQARDARVIAVDGGVRLAWFYGRQPHVVIGDMDSLNPDELEKARSQGAQIERHPPEKDETDLELALIYTVEQGVHWLRIIGAIGGRFDQMLANVYLLALPQLADCDVAIVAGNQTLALLRPGTHTIRGDVGDTLSLIPISGDVLGVCTDGLQYALHDETLAFGPARGISNVLQAGEAQIKLAEGLLLCVHTEGEA
ncbi:MAG: thiamine diphosphokinase [Anaerolineae bacterium]